MEHLHKQLKQQGWGNMEHRGSEPGLAQTHLGSDLCLAQPKETDQPPV